MSFVAPYNAGLACSELARNVQDWACQTPSLQLETVFNTNLLEVSIGRDLETLNWLRGENEGVWIQQSTKGYGRGGAC